MPETPNTPLSYDFFYNPSNIANQQLLRETIAYFESGPRVGLFDPLEFMNILWGQYQALKANLEQPYSFVQQILQSNYTEIQKHIIIGLLIKWFGGYPVKNLDPAYDSILKLLEDAFFKTANGAETPEMTFCATDIAKEQQLKKMAREVEININAQMANGEIIKNSSYAHRFKFEFGDLPDYIIRKAIFQRFEHTLSLHKNEDYIEWQQGLADFLNQVPEQYRLLALEKALEYGEKVLEYHIQNECSDPSTCRFNESLNRRITLTKSMLKRAYADLKEMEEANKQNSIENDPGNPEFTLARQVLALYYLLEQSGVSNVDNSSKARFIQFITGRETNAKQISNTNIYKKIRNPFPANEAALTKDLQFIRNYFEELGLKTIVDKINKEIGSNE